MSIYIPRHFVVPQVDILHRLIRAHPLSTLVTLTTDGLNANHIPQHLLQDSGPFGILRGHVARANPVWNDLNKDVEALAISQGPDGYISPSWCPTKAKTGKVVPTWNYAVVHAYGALRVIDKPAWLRTHLEGLTAHNEAKFSQPWRLDDAPIAFTEKLIESIVGIEIVITRLLGKFKASQNQSAVNQAVAIRGLRASGDARAMEMADLMKTPLAASCKISS